MLWDIIRDWFVQYLWGGFTSTNQYFGGCIGQIQSLDFGSGDIINSGSFYLQIPNATAMGENADYTSGLSLSLGDWLSTTSTIIVLFFLCLFLFLVVRYLFRLTSGLIRGR